MNTIRSLLAGAFLASAAALAVAATPAEVSDTSDATRPAMDATKGVAADTATSPWAGLDPHLICLPGETPAAGTPAVFA